jgi:colanic acid biosynthesis glycosyl transferase WcaI
LRKTGSGTQIYLDLTKRNRYCGISLFCNFAEMTLPTKEKEPRSNNCNCMPIGTKTDPAFARPLPATQGIERAVMVSCVFPPESLTSASTSYAVARTLSRSGVDVTVLAPYPSRPGGLIYSGFRRRFFSLKSREGAMQVIRCFSLFSRSASLLSRSCENISFGITAAIWLVFLRKPDVIYSNTWPIFATGLVRLIARCRRIPLVISVQDVYPESLVSLRKISGSGLFIRLLNRWDAWIARGATALIVISRQMKRIYVEDRKIPANRIHLIPNWRDPEELPELASVKQRRGEWQLSTDDFVFLIAGNIASACGIENVVRAFTLLPESIPARMIVAGSGSALDLCCALAASTTRGKVRFPGAFRPEETLEILCCGDALILPTQGEQALVSFPSKLISYMMAAKPIVAVAREQSDLAAIIRETGCGWLVGPGDPEALQNCLRAVTECDKELLKEMGLRGREYALEHFSSDACLPQVISALQRAAAQAPSVME